MTRLPGSPARKPRSAARRGTADRSLVEARPDGYAACVEARWGADGSESTLRARLLLREDHHSVRMIWTAAAVGIAISAPRIPSSAAPARTATIVTIGLTWRALP